MNFGDWFNENIKSDSTNSIYLNIFLNIKNYPTFRQWATLQYYNFNLLFDAETFGRKFLALLINKKVELNRIETLNKFIETKPITEDDLGNVITSTTTSSANSSGKTSNSYSGYNVDNGEFSNTSNTADTTNKGTASTTSINRMGQLYNMANYEIRNLFNNINIDLIKLFQTIY